MKKKESNDIEKGQCPTHVSEPVSENFMISLFGASCFG